MQTKVTKFIGKYKLLLAVVLFASFLRLYSIDSNPPSMNWDEISHGYNAYSVLKTGKDEWGETLPLIFRAYGDYKLPVYIYVTAKSVWLFGLNAFAVRLPSVLAGVGTVIFTYLLSLELLRQKKSKSPITNHKSLAALAALFVAIEPWTLFLSRPAFEANLALFFFVGGVYFFLKALPKAGTRYLLLSSVFLGLTVWTYNSYRVFTPLMVMVLVFIYRLELKGVYKINRSKVHWSLVTTVLLFLPVFYQMINPQGQARYEWVAILDEGAINEIIEQRNTSEFSPIVSQILYNKGTYFTQKFLNNYFAHFNPKFLFIEGGSHYQFSVPGHGLIYAINSIFLLVGLVWFAKRRDKSAWLLLSWLVMAPIPSSLTREAPHVLRSITILPVPMILTSIGLIWTAKRLLQMENGKWKMENILRIFGFVYVLLLFLYSGNYWQKYFNDYRKNYSWSWQYGYEQVVDYAKENYHEYDKIIVTKKYGEPHEFFLFYWTWGPEDYRSDPNLIRFNQSNWYWVDAFDKLYFVNDWQVDEEGTGNYNFNLESKKMVPCAPAAFQCLLITSPKNVPEDWNKLDTINFLDGEPAFEIYEN